MQDSWYRNQQLGWHRVNYRDYRLLTYGDQKVSLYYPLNNQNPTQILDNGTYLELECIADFIYNCRNELFSRVFCLTSDGVKLLSNMGVLALKDIMEEGLCTILSRFLLIRC